MLIISICIACFCSISLYPAMNFMDDKNASKALKLLVYSSMILNLLALCALVTFITNTPNKRKIDKYIPIQKTVYEKIN